MFKENDRVVLKNISENILCNNNFFTRVSANKILENYKKGHLIVYGTNSINVFLNVILYDAIFDEDDRFVCGLIKEMPDLNGKSFAEIKDLLGLWDFNDSQMDYFENTSLELNAEVFEIFLE